MPKIKGDSLRNRLGSVYLELDSPVGAGIDRLNSLLGAFYEELASDLLVGFFFDSKDLSAIRTAQASFLLKAMGVTQSYSGHPPAKAHLKLPPILSGHFDRRLIILRKHLEAAGLSPEAIRTWIEFENSFRPGIVS